MAAGFRPDHGKRYRIRLYEQDQKRLFRLCVVWDLPPDEVIMRALQVTAAIYGRESELKNEAKNKENAHALQRRSITPVGKILRGHGS